ncbi:hypothetical protein V9L13_13410 [Pseudomonas sp. RSB 5.4]|uniref:hypothetical protein n=1 Tax=Pseudomonas sp. RSB 5.4 TaxID=3127459 RepID=UPI0030CF7CAF
MSTAASFQVVSIARRRRSNIHLVRFAQSAFNILLAHAGNHSLIDDRCAALPGIDQVAAFVLQAANDAWFTSPDCHTGYFFVVVFRHDRHDRSGRVGLNLLQRELLIVRTTQGGEGDAAVGCFASVKGAGNPGGRQAEQAGDYKTECSG